MGNAQQISHLEQQQNSEIDIQQVLPFKQGQKITTKSQEESQLQNFLVQRAPDKNNNEGDDQKQDTEREINLDYEINNYKGMGTESLFMEVKKIEDSFAPEQLDSINESFDMYSFENKMAKKKLLEYFGLLDFQDHNLGHLFFQCLLQQFPSNFSGPYLDYSKFLKVISLLSCENKEGRMRFIFQMFDRKQKSNLEREDAQFMLESIYDCLMSVNIQGNTQFNALKQDLLKCHERDIDVAMKKIIDQMMEFGHGESGGIDYHGYVKWMQSQECMTQCMEFNPHECNTYYD